MIKGRLIVSIASSWDYDPTSKHHLMRILSRHNDVLWINYHGSRRPEINGRDLKGTCSALARVSHGIRRATSSIFQLTPLVLPGATNPLLQRLHQRMLIAQIRRGIRIVSGGREKPVQVWSFAPDVPYLVGPFDEECFIYYCVDEYTQFEGFDSRRIAAAENEMIDRADVVVTTSEPLLITKRARRHDTVLVRHGVDYDHFAAAWWSSLPRPADLAAIPRPIFGFFGLLHHWVDCALLAKVARLRPLYSFVLIGDCKVGVGELERLDNVFLLGRRPYEDLPAYCAAFDAGMLLFARNAMTRNVNPVKMYEYLAAGLPIVSTPLPEAERYEGPIIIADTAERFAQACDRVLATQHSGDREAISRLVENETWASKVEYLSDIIVARANRALPTVSKPRQDVVPTGRTEREIAAATC
ncbi:MAG: glycosyltransferase [Phycisphaerales bacterium]|nr:MAG: glycosyltransferase [Phycisphaerales bacterium]